MLPYFSFDNFFYLSQQIGLFTVLLPFLLIFSVVYAILVRIDIFKKTPAAGVIVALAVAFFALTNQQISFIMAKLFSNLAIGLLILLSFVIIFGLLNKDITTNFGWFILVVAIIIVVVVIARAFEARWWYFFSSYIQIFLPIIIILVAVILIVVFSRETPPQKKFSEALEEALFGEKSGRK